MNELLLTKCLRCSGAVVYDKFYGVGEQFWGWKCLICGEIVDSVILKNRHLMLSGQEIYVGKARRLKNVGVRLVIPEKAGKSSVLIEIRTQLKQC